MRTSTVLGKLILRFVLTIGVNGPRNDKILLKSVDKPDTSPVNPPGNLFQALDKYLPMKSDSNGGTLGNVMCDLLSYVVRIDPDGTFLVLLPTKLRRRLIQQRLRSG